MTMTLVAWAVMAGLGAEDAATKTPPPLKVGQNAEPDDSQPDGFKRRPAATFKWSGIPGAGARPWAPGEQIRCKAHDEVVNDCNLGNCEIALLRSKEIGVELKVPKAELPTLALAADELESRNLRLEKLLVEGKDEQANSELAKRPRQDRLLLAETFSKEQLERLGQLILHFQGPRISIREWPETAERIGIDREEANKLSNAVALSWTMEMNGMVLSTTEYGLYRAAKDRRFLAALTPKQRAAWEKLVGPPALGRRHPDHWPKISD